MAYRASPSQARGSRGRGRARGRAFYPRMAEPDPIPTNLGEIVTSISSSELRPSVSEPTVLRNAEAVASFNWIGNVDQPTISIPGAPPKWSPPQNTLQLSEDSGTYYRDLNAAYSPTYPLHATALSILSNPTIDISSVDLMACASTLRSLLLFTLGERQTFRIMVEEVGDTLFFIRRGNSPREAIPGVRGYGHTFPEAYTDWHESVHGSVSNQRVIQYRFAGMKCFVRYESDGYLPNKLSHTPTPFGQQDPSMMGPAERGEDVDEVGLDTALDSLGVSMHPPTLRGDEGIHTVHSGIHIPQSATFELKTRAFHRRNEDFFLEFVPRLWITQTAYLVLAFHNSGRFESDNIRVRDVRAEVEAWEAEHQQEIKKLANLLHWIVKQVRDAPDGQIELWRHECGDLEARRPTSDFVGALPEDVDNRWKSIAEGGVSVAPFLDSGARAGDYDHDHDSEE